MKKALLTIAACALFAGLPVWSGEGEEDDAAAIRKRIESYAAAYNQHDAQALAGHWAENAVYIDRETGQRIEGRAAIADMFRSLFQEEENQQLSVNVEAIRIIPPNVAIEDGTAEIVSADGEPISSTYTAVHVKQDGAWYLDSIRETQTPASASPENSPLDQLGWLVGQWLDEDENATVRTHWSWSKNRRFITGAFSISVDNRIELEGTQIIGWDPAQERIRSWVFDSDGGFGEAYWRRAGNQWTVESTSTLSDGSQGSAINLYTRLDDDSFTFSSVERQVGGEAQSDIDPVTVRRQ
ncbi:MAG: YybH family protein [Aureliella sp.]